MDGRHGTLPRHYRAKARNWGFYSVLAAGLVGMLLTIWWEMPASREVKALWTVLLAALTGWALHGRSRQMTTVDEDGISVRGVRGLRRLTWDGIHDIRSESMSPTRSWGPETVTHAYRTDGRRVLLVCVDDEELPALEPELAFLRSLLLRQRTADWTPDPRAEPRIARQNARRAAVDRWASGWRAMALIFGGAAALIAGIVLPAWVTGRS